MKTKTVITELRILVSLTGTFLVLRGWAISLVNLKAPSMINLLLSNIVEITRNQIYARQYERKLMLNPEI